MGKSHWSKGTLKGACVDIESQTIKIENNQKKIEQYKELINDHDGSERVWQLEIQQGRDDIMATLDEFNYEWDCWTGEGWI